MSDYRGVGLERFRIREVSTVSEAFVYSVHCTPKTPHLVLYSQSCTASPVQPVLYSQSCTASPVQLVL